MEQRVRARPPPPPPAEPAPAVPAGPIEVDIGPKMVKLEEMEKKAEAFASKAEHAVQTLTAKDTAMEAQITGLDQKVTAAIGAAKAEIQGKIGAAVKAVEEEMRKAVAGGNEFKLLMRYRPY